MILPVGSVVTVTTRFPKRNIWNKENYEDYIITGTILPSPKWLTTEQIAVSNPTHPNGFSVIGLNHIINIKNADGEIKLTLPSNDYKEWAFSGSKGNNYLVIRTKGNYTCSCPGFQYRKHCKHVEEASHE